MKIYKNVIDDQHCYLGQEVLDALELLLSDEIDELVEIGLCVHLLFFLCQPAPIDTALVPQL